ncbi:valine--tRNA ligase [Mycoplasmopsis bovis]|uniref:Valine--tRNA ligase n=1 Tax=Mycoplasmopsis bovis TaxID=28903 RepID=A0A2N8U1L6_MYCBV|nr:valine--tRNA ligase [Mycoplasmopsis bovis]AXJ68270.1 valine--tRNA ligase [Mycoplasmopsis bovis]AXJ69795.1 valine--tRNA ligase [Mycoplasmopsis bovis]AXJ70572.1 valine--tRNA ligase [Mycoplasmopsis bovis]AXJ71408.1 valine--tRNA ligase [Mycoplasmopsis bovis]AXJ72262.1 valine--tRNA ligase [Mycoplasmopsis bovis]
MDVIDKTYAPQNFEKAISKKWIDKKFFSQHDLAKKPFSLLLPPPNVTGVLHIGHALDQYIQDTILRYKKLEGYDTFYIAGMDHAGIATQSKVESVLLQTEGLSRHNLGREKFIEKVWKWKETYANKFREQWLTLGIGLDYERERFTLDKLSNDAVNKVFIELYNKGLIYRDTKAINWDPVLKTALSNIEVINKSTEQIMYYIKYKIEGRNDFLTVATVRLETLLSDVAVVFNPTDGRYKHLENMNVIHPLTNEIIPIIKDEYVDKKFASGLMKLSAHAEVDIDIIKQHNLQIKEIIDQEGKINYPSSQFHGLTREEAREAIAKYLKNNDLIVKEEKTISNVGYSERSNTPIETLVMPQWFVKMENLAKKVINHLKSADHVKFYPKRFIKTVNNWLANMHDWTISRQLWWGHRIPAWYSGNEVKVQVECPGEGWVQDSDVLDTWFSSGIAPFSFLGWPASDELLKRYYPTNLLVTGYDIIFFWVVRMYFFSLEFTNKKPFETVLLHGLVRDELNRKMSKSLNNGVDPVKVIEEYGSDSLRFFLVTSSSPGLDTRFSIEKIRSAWGLCNKLWNIARYINMLDDDNVSEPSVADIWINNKLKTLQNKISKAMNKYELTIAGSELSNFIFNDFSSWYIELLRIYPNKKQALENLRKLLIIAHPFLPFVTDYLYQSVYKKDLLDEQFPILKLSRSSKVGEIERIINVVKILRKFREDKSISKKEIINYYVSDQFSNETISAINRMANASLKENNHILFTDGNLKVWIEENESLKKDRLADLNKKIEQVRFEINRAQNMLNNPNFINKAPKEKIALEQEKLEKYKKQLAEYEKEV